MVFGLFKNKLNVTDNLAIINYLIIEEEEYTIKKTQ